MDIKDPFYTYCANHPHRNPDRLQTPVGPVFRGDPRKVWKLCPDTEDVRRVLMQIAATIVEKPRQEYPLGHPLDVVVIWQLGEFAETRAIQELQRIASFDETVESEGPFTRSSESAVLAAREALRKIVGCLVTRDHPDLVTLVGIQGLDEQHRPSGEQFALTAGLLDRSLRERDARELGIVHIEDDGEPPDQVSREVAAAWAKLVHRAEQAQQTGSNWGRFAIPLEGIAVLSGADAARPPRSLDHVSMPKEVRTQIEDLEDIVRQAGRLPDAVTVWSGLQLGNTAGPPNESQASFEQVFTPGQLVELRGILSGSAVIEPPLYAAGMQGAILETEIHSAANMALMMPREGEEEYLLPRDCRCRIMAVEPNRTYTTQDGDKWSRRTVRLQQL